MSVQNLLQADFFLQIITQGRLSSIMAGLVGVIAVIIGRLAIIRSTRNPNSGRLMGIVAIVVGLAGMALSILHLVRTTGAGFGTGKGRAGAIVGVLVGLVGMVLGTLALIRSRRIAKRSSVQR